MSRSASGSKQVGSAYERDHRGGLGQVQGLREEGTSWKGHPGRSTKNGVYLRTNKFGMVDEWRQSNARITNKMASEGRVDAEVIIEFCKVLPKFCCDRIAGKGGCCASDSCWTRVYLCMCPATGGVTRRSSRSETRSASGGARRREKTL